MSCMSRCWCPWVVRLVRLCAGAGSCRLVQARAAPHGEDCEKKSVPGGLYRQAAQLRQALSRQVLSEDRRAVTVAMVATGWLPVVPQAGMLLVR